ncbi:MAG: glutamate racemase [Coriobacteriales bacterium]|nr:glutamate racemase [Coriobacteriales bacterium]
MSNEEFAGYVGVFDSGVGGISILRALVSELPQENFVFFGDSAHNPYGEKTTEQVYELSRSIVERLLSAGCKAIVIACNTATSAAANRLRERWPEVPIIGVEPALKPAVLARKGGRVLVMATPLTVRLDKFQHLLDEWGSEAEVISVPCEGLAARVEQADLEAPDVRELIESLVGSYAGKVDEVVLGCTHYPFVCEQIRQVLGDVTFFDSAGGTARQLRRRLEECDLLAGEGTGKVVFLTSKDDPAELDLYRWFFSVPELS